MVKIIGWTILVLFLLDRLGLWMEARGWIYYRKKQGSGSTVGSALMQMHSFVEPQVTHAMEEKGEDREEDHSGDPLEPPPQS